MEMKKRRKKEQRINARPPSLYRENTATRIARDFVADFERSVDESIEEVREN